MAVFQFTGFVRHDAPLLYLPACIPAADQIYRTREEAGLEKPQQKSADDNVLIRSKSVNADAPTA